MRFVLQPQQAPASQSWYVGHEHPELLELLDELEDVLELDELEDVVPLELLDDAVPLELLDEVELLELPEPASAPNSRSSVDEQANSTGSTNPKNRSFAMSNSNGG